MQKVGLIGWRGMVGSVLMQRMLAEDDFAKITPYFFSTSNPGSQGPALNSFSQPLQDANSVAALAQMDIILTCQGGDYTNAIYPKLLKSGWSGYWIDAASALRMHQDACIILDPVNRTEIDKAIQRDGKLFVGGNCSITLSMMGLAGLLNADLIEWMSLMTYQSASGAGARQVRELIEQSSFIHSHLTLDERSEQHSVLALVEKVSALINHAALPTNAFGVPLIGSVIPWIDSDLGNGNSREEWKGDVELNKILGLDPSTIAVDGLCVRVGVLRCHSAAITMKLKRDITESEFADLVSSGNPWVSYIPNNKEQSIKELTPAALSGSLQVGVGRFKKLSIKNETLYSVFTVGDQLLWGAAEPLRRMLNILLNRI